MSRHQGPVLCEPCTTGVALQECAAHSVCTHSHISFYRQIMSLHGHLGAQANIPGRCSLHLPSAAVRGACFSSPTTYCLCLTLAESGFRTVTRPHEAHMCQWAPPSTYMQLLCLQRPRSGQDTALVHLLVSVSFGVPRSLAALNCLEYGNSKKYKFCFSEKKCSCW